MQLVTAVGVRCGLLLGTSPASGSERLKAAVHGGGRMSDAQLVGATALAAFDGEWCTELLKDKVVALSKVVGL